MNFNPASLLDDLLGKFFPATAGSPTFADLWNVFFKPSAAAAPVPSTAAPAKTSAAVNDPLSQLIKDMSNAL